MSVANGSPYYQPPAILREFEETLSPLMLWFANDGDILIKNELPSDEFTEHLSKLGLDTSCIRTKENAFSEIIDKGVQATIMPWGWSPATNYFFKDAATNTPLKDAKSYVDRYERKNAVKLLGEIIDKNQSQSLISKEQLPVIVYSEEEIEELLNRWEKIVLKAPLSSSGRGLQIIRNKPLNNSKRQWIKTILKQQEYIVCEPLLDKQADLSFQFQVDSDKKINYLGISYFKTNKNGQYQGHYLNKVPETIAEFEKEFSKDTLNEIVQYLMKYLEQKKYLNYESYIGIDALVFKENNQLKLQHCIEINPRFNMGILSMKIQENIHPEAKGYFEIFNGDDYSDFVQNSTKKNPPKFIDGKLATGFFSLTEARPNQRFGAFINLNVD